MGTDKTIENEPIGLVISTTDNATKDQSGQWTVVRTLTQAISTDGKNFIVRDYSIKAIDKVLEKAQDTLSKATARLLTEYNNNLFSKKEWSGNQYMVSAEPEDVLPDTDKIIQ